MFDDGKVTYKSDVQLGERYRDRDTGIGGVASAIYFFMHACERVTLEYVHDGELKDVTFDAPRLERVSTSEPVRGDRPGGPRREVDVRRGFVG
jgi:hypothetical protein